uniref:GDP-fucose protein O-fucosyltransferase 1 n=1 Tax=Panagrellus redivivus TaxID=6233 RepID=A0A7E4ZW71_PANRE
MQYLFLPIFISISLASVSQATPTVDPNGYVAFCPCMGRFGNQIDQLLGSLSFAKQLNRTLLLPPLVEYPTGKPAAAMVPFETIFEVSEVAKYHRVIPMGDFMRDLANSIWPKSKRAAFCWRPREGIYDKEAPPSCNAKEGNPFGPFWDYSRIDFVRDVYYGEVIRSGYDLGRHGAKSAWEVNYPAETYPVLAFTGAPGAFPVNAEDRHLQKYLKFRPRITDKAFKFIKESLPRPFVGIHLRNNVDWRQPLPVFITSLLFEAVPISQSSESQPTPAIKMTDPLVHIHHAILYEFQRGSNATEAHENLAKVFGEHTPVVSTIHKWYHRFEDGNFDLEDHRHHDHHEGKHVPVTPTQHHKSPSGTSPIGQPGPRKFDLDELRALAREHPEWSTGQFAEALDVTHKTALRWLDEIGVPRAQYDRVCDHLKPHTKSRAQLFASAQCIGYNGEKGVLTHEVCQPSEATVLDEVENYVASLGAKSVFVSSDRDHLIPELNDRLKRYNAKAVKLDNDDPHVSLAILTRADHFIGNCISTFSAFVSRSREFGPLQAFRSTSFFGFEPDRARSIEL